MAHKFNPTDYADRAATREAARNAVARLNQIISGIDAATTAQIKTAIKDMAGYDKHLIKLVVGSLT
jgi:hypothetical protein